MTIQDSAAMGKPGSRLMCSHCGQPARVHTPFGFMCDSHGLREMLEAHERGEKDWMPLALRAGAVRR